MNIGFTDMTMPRLSFRCSETAQIEGKAPLPQGAREILFTSGCIYVDSTTVSNGELGSEGRVVVKVICRDEDGELFSFTATAGFTHSMTCQEGEKGMNAQLTAQLQSIDGKISGDSLLIQAQADMLYRLEDSRSEKVINGGDDMELLTRKFTYRSREQVARATTHLREDIVTSNISSVVYADATAIIRDISCVVDTARVDGILNLNALCYDKSKELVHLKQNIPFTAELETDYDNCQGLVGRAVVNDVVLRMTQDEYGLSTVEAEVMITLFATKVQDGEVTLDAFSPSRPFQCTKKPLQLMLYKESTEQKGLCKELFTVKDPPEYPAFINVNPLTVSATRGEMGIIVDGILKVDMLYPDSQNNLKAASDTLPFSLTLPGNFENTEIDANTLCTGVTVGEIKEDGIELNVALHMSADIYELFDMEVVTGVSECQPPVSEKGFVVCFAAEGETVYEIAKRFNVSQKDLLQSNPNLGDTLHAGDKAVLLSR